MDSNVAEPLPASRGHPEPSPNPQADLDRLREDFRTFMADCRTLLKTATSLSSEGATIARGELSKRVADAQSRLGDARQTANDHAMRARECTEDYVRREPFKAVGIAAAAGALVALLLARR